MLEREGRCVVEAVIPEVSGVDIELASTDILSKVVEIAHSQDRIVIVSNHNFDATPTTARLVEMAQQVSSPSANNQDK